MVREVFYSEIVVISDTFGDIFGAKAESAMKKSALNALLEIVRRLPSSFDDLEEGEIIEMFRKTHLFLGLEKGFARAERKFYFTAKTRTELEEMKMKRERDVKILLELCPDFPMEHLDAFYSLYTAYGKKMLRRRPLREYLGETSEEMAKREEWKKKREAKRAERIKAEKARKPNGLELLAFFSQPKEIRDVLYHFPIQLDRLSDIDESDFMDAAKKAGVTKDDVFFAYERYNAYRLEFEDFTTSENGAPCGKIIYLRAEKDEEADLLESGSCVFLLHEIKADERLSEADEEEIFKPHIEKAFSEGYSFAHCYLITEPISSLPLTITEETWQV